MTEDQIRALVRDVVARHLGAEPAPTSPPRSMAAWKDHVSHARLQVPSGEQSEGPCIVEPAVKCHHCGFCQSFGH